MILASKIDLAQWPNLQRERKHKGGKKLRHINTTEKLLEIHGPFVNSYAAEATEIK